MFKKNRKLKEGFSLIEITVVIFFTMVLTTITVYNYKDFDSSIELKNQALGVALAIKEAQISALSARGFDVSDQEAFSHAYGVFFDITGGGGNNSYVFFVDSVDDTLQEKFWFDDVNWNCNPGNECIKKYDLQNGYTISRICTLVDCSDTQNTIGISFERPNPEAVIRRNNNPDVDQDSVKIELSSPKGKTRYVHVTKAGQIYIDNE